MASVEIIAFGFIALVLLYGMYHEQRLVLQANERELALSKVSTARENRLLTQIEDLNDKLHTKGMQDYITMRSIRSEERAQVAGIEAAAGREPRTMTGEEAADHEAMKRGLSDRELVDAFTQQVNPVGEE